ncbi:hypothetical protein HDU83_009488 [Entophlyctis luteolus]|nr:hypothetical protein HDU83_009488 [Entophlyctis luteolus]
MRFQKKAVKAYIKQTAHARQVSAANSDSSIDPAFEPAKRNAAVAAAASSATANTAPSVQPPPPSPPPQSPRTTNYVVLPASKEGEHSPTGTAQSTCVFDVLSHKYRDYEMRLVAGRHKELPISHNGNKPSVASTTPDAAVHAILNKLRSKIESLQQKCNEMYDVGESELDQSVVSRFQAEIRELRKQIHNLTSLSH